MIVFSPVLTQGQKLFLWISGAILALSIIWYLIDPSGVALLFAIAMLFSFIGDLFMKRILRVTDKKLVDGVLGFGIAHVLYLVGLISLLKETNIYIILLINALIAFVLFRIIAYRPDKPFQSAAIFLYIILLLTLLSISGMLVLLQGSAFLILAIGFALFVASDFMIGVREFFGRFSHDNFLVSITYLLAQALLQIYPHL